MPRLSPWLMALNVATLGITLVLNTLANALPLNSRTTGAISDSFTQNVFVPAGYVFSIWGLIYVALTGFVIYQLTPTGRQSGAVQQVGGWFAISSLANSGWILAWHAGVFPLTMLAMGVVLGSLAVIVWRIYRRPGTVGLADRLLVQAPFSLYLGWISVATIANAAVVLLDLGWTGAPLSPAGWAVVLLAVASLLGGIFVLRRGDLVYGGVIVWAFAGIGVKQAGYPVVALVAWAGVALLVLLIMGQLLRRAKRPTAAPAQPLGA